MTFQNGECSASSSTCEAEKTREISEEFMILSLTKCCETYCWLYQKDLYIYRVSQKNYPLLAGNGNETIRYHYSPSGQLNLSIFNLDPHTLHLKIGHQRPGIQACKVKIYSAPETRGFVKGPSHDFLSQACCTGISTLTFSSLH